MFEMSGVYETKQKELCRSRTALQLTKLFPEEDGLTILKSLYIHTGME